MRVERRLDWLVRTAQFFLEEQETGSASQQIKRAHALLTELPKPSSPSPLTSSSTLPPTPLLLLSFKTCYARVLDSERKFLEAAQRYYELSQSPPDLVSPSDCLISLQNAVTCAILAKPSPSRTRILSLLSQDDRTPSLPSSSLLNVVYRGLIIPPSLLQSFEGGLADHQKAEMGGGMTVVRSAMMEHNIEAMSRRWSSVGMMELSSVLGVEVTECEKVVEEMIQQGRLKGKIDQVEGMVEFDEESGKGGDEALLLRWDDAIEETCLQVNRIVDSIQSKYPQFVLP